MYFIFPNLGPLKYIKCKKMTSSTKVHQCPIFKGTYFSMYFTFFSSQNSSQLRNFKWPPLVMGLNLGIICSAFMNRCSYEVDLKIHPCFLLRKTSNRTFKLQQLLRVELCRDSENLTCQISFIATVKLRIHSFNLVFDNFQIRLRIHSRLFKDASYVA